MTPLAPAASTAAGIETAWALLGQPGDWWTAAERVALAAEVRASRSCSLCSERKAALSPYAVATPHGAHPVLPAAALDAVHRINTDPGRLARRLLDDFVAAGLQAEALVEIAGLVGLVTIADTLDAGLGQPERPLPEPAPGEPSRTPPVGLRVDGGWVPMVHPDEAEGETRMMYDMVEGMAGFVFNVARSLTASPVSTRGFFSAFMPNYATHGPVPAGGLTRPQVEVLASTTSALNDCFY